MFLKNPKNNCVCAFVWQLREFSDDSSSSSVSSSDEDLDDTAHQEEDQHNLPESLAEPEFAGLWDQDCKVPKNTAN